MKPQVWEYQNMSWAKYRRAEEHYESLGSEVSSWIELVNAAPRRAERPKPSVWVLLIDAPPTPWERWALVLGDISHNLRCALDHAVFHYWDGDGGRTSQFPICDTAEAFAQSRERMIGGLPPAMQDAIEKVQPFHEDRSETSWLGILRELSNADKHRALVVTGCALNRLEGTVDTTPMEAERTVAYPESLGFGGETELVRISIPESARFEHIEIDVSVFVALQLTNGHAALESLLPILADGVAQVLSMLDSLGASL